MYILIAVLIGMVLGFIRRGSIRAILEHPYKNWVFGAVGVVLEAFVHLFCFVPASTGVAAYLPIVSFLAYILLFITLIYNLDDVYTILISIGVTLNFVVTFINGGLMPVSTSVIDVMPLHAALTQAIYAGTGGVYMILVPTQTLLAFLSTTIPVPFFANITVMTGFVSGLSIGSILLLLGLIGLTQSAMTLPVESVPEVETVITNKERYPVPEVEPETTRHFDSKTAELFYEEDKPPRNPLDKMFREEEPKRQPTQVLREINVSPSAAEKTVEPDASIAELADLTRPISETLTINLKEEMPEPEEAPEEIIEGEGFFVSQFNAEKQKQSPDETEEPVVASETEEEPEASPETKEEPEAAIETEERSYSRNDLLSALDSAPILEKTLTNDLELEEEELKEDIIPEEIPIEAQSIEESVEEAEAAVEETIETEEESGEEILLLESSESAVIVLPESIEEPGEAILLGGPTEEAPTRSDTQILERLEGGDRGILEELLAQSGLENLDEILDSEIDMSSIIVENSGDTVTDIDRIMQELGQKRGSIQEDERTGYMLTKAYIDMSNRDKSEEQMLDIWSQVAEENRERKLGRRRRASANYQTSNPYSEERERTRQQELDRIRVEQEEKRWKEREKLAENARHQEETAKTVNAQSDVDTTLMSDEERIAAGYEKVNFDFSGKTISFWRKKNA